MKLITKYCYPLIVLGILFSFTSCMHPLMMGGHTGRDEHAPAKIIKEVSNDEFIVSVSIEPITSGNAASIALSISSKTIAPDSVIVHFVISKQSDLTDKPTHNQGTSSHAHGDFNLFHGIITAKHGVVAIPFAPKSPEDYLLSLEIEKQLNNENSFSMEVPFSVTLDQSPVGNGIFGISSEYWYLGSFVMAGMMVVMWSTRGGIF